MFRLSKRQRDKTYKILAERDGDQCRICGVPGTVKQLVVDCVDNSGDHSDPENLQLLCSSDNTRKNPRGLGRFNPRRPKTTEDFELKRVGTIEMQRNLEAEPRFRHWLHEQVKLHEEILLSEAINAGAEFAGCSQQTVKRYIDKAASSVGPFMLEKNGDGNAALRFKRGARTDRQR